jgi:hypothetical protein
MRRTFLIGTLALLLVGGGVYGWSQMHARGYS